MISLLRTRFSTGTRIGDGVGGAVRAAASAGDSIRSPATQAPAATAAMSSKRPQSATIRFVVIDVSSYDAACILAGVVRGLPLKSAKHRKFATAIAAAGRTFPFRFSLRPDQIARAGAS